MPIAKQRAPRSAPPKQPTSNDKQLLAFAQEAELAVHDLYATVVSSSKFTGDEAAMLSMFTEHHKAYAQAINGLLGKEATNRRNESIYQTYVGQLTTMQSIYATLQALENTLAKTHIDLLGNLEGIDGAQLVASIITAEARHAAVFGTLPTLSLSSALDNPAASIAPASSAPATPETTVAP